MTILAIYTCPRHPEVLSGKCGKCPKCGIELIEKNKLFIKNIRIAAVM